MPDGGFHPFRPTLGVYRSQDGWSTVRAGRPPRLWCSVAERLRADASRRYLAAGQQEYRTILERGGARMAGPSSVDTHAYESHVNAARQPARSAGAVMSALDRLTVELGKRDERDDLVVHVRACHPDGTVGALLLHHLQDDVLTRRADRNHHNSVRA